MGAVRTFFLLLLALFLLAGCAGQSAPSDVLGGQIAVGLNAEPLSLDPAEAAHADAKWVILQLADTLIREAPDGTLEPGLALDWQLSEDNKSLAFNLRQGVLFHNGDEMTAADVVFSLNRALKGGGVRAVAGAIEDVRQVGGYQVFLTLKYPFAPILRCLSDAGFGIVSQRAVQDAQTRGTDFGRAPVGTGPYRLESWEQGEQLVLARFADYYRGQAAIGVVSCRFVGDSAGGAAALEAGRIDLYRSVSIPERQKLLQNASLQHQEGAGTVLWHLSFNMNSTLFGDIRVRQATAHAIDRVHLVEEGFDGFGVPVACPMPPPAFGYQGAMEPLALNPAQSQALLAEAGFAQGVPAALRVVDTPESVKLAQLICEQLAPAGIRLSVEPMSFKEYLAQVADKCDYDIALYSIDSVILDADYACSRRLHSTLAGSGNNFSRYDSLQADALLKSAREQNDPALRDQLYAELSLLVRDEAPVLPLFAQTGVVFARNGLLGLYYHPDDKLMIYDLTW